MLIQNADLEGFKSAFDTVNLPIECTTGLLRTICNAMKELVATRVKTQTSKITEGIVEMIIGIISGLWLVSFACSMTSDRTPETMKKFAGAGFNLTTLLRNKLPEKLSLPSFLNRAVVCGIGSVLGIVAFCFTFNGLTEGYKNLKVGFNYKQCLQHKLTNLETIAVYIAAQERNAEDASKLMNIDHKYFLSFIKLHVGFRSLSFIFLINIGIAQGMEEEAIEYLYKSISSIFSRLYSNVSSSTIIQAPQESWQIQELRTSKHYFEQDLHIERLMQKEDANVRVCSAKTGKDASERKS